MCRLFNILIITLSQSAIYVRYSPNASILENYCKKAIIVIHNVLLYWCYHIIFILEIKKLLK